MSHRVLPAGEAYWRPSNQMGVLNTDLAKQLEAQTHGARLWRLAAGQASTRHRHAEQAELYLLLEGAGRMRVGDETLTLEPLSAVLVEPDTVRQLFNDTDADALWLIVGAPSEAANTLQMTEEQLRFLYPDRTQGSAPRACPTLTPRHLLLRPRRAPLRIDRLDHLVLTVADVERTVDFYSRVLGMDVVSFGSGRRALTFAATKINLHQVGHEFEPKAATPTPGSADLCLISVDCLDAVLAHLAVCGVCVEEGPVQRTGATGPITSVYFRDPDRNLVEISNY